ncbi:hypothetical protein J7355_15550 [Endozoicomonas sp. G2_2]|uniref:hypothetical protein n=1 Tax=Endozoicomonas sp. G2_2 TaxID=2821092 RepID=UPI001ADCFA7F|nr:hypothetical protein [Endozoicomonas sp. G2_2]MBO9471504.1 hypothetical protein [Endozoicomonas sp. G2_2]
MILSTATPALTADFGAAVKRCQTANLNRHFVCDMAGLIAASEEHTINCGTQVVAGDSVLFLMATRDRRLFSSRRNQRVRLEIITSRVAHVGLLDARGNRFARLADHPADVSNRLDAIARYGCWRKPWPSPEGRDEALRTLEARLDEELNAFSLVC